MALRNGIAKRLPLFLAGALIVRAQAPAPVATGPIIGTDRPAFTDASTVVGTGTLVLENGFLETGAPGQRSFDFPETLARFGIFRQDRNTRHDA